MLTYAHGNDVSTLDLVEYLADETAETFDFLQYLRDAFPDDAEWNAAITDRSTIGAQIRRSATENDPLLFAALYLRHHLSGQETRNNITFSDFHLDLCRHRNNWMAELDTPAAIRDAYVAPRGCGKSTWLFLIMPMWVAALQYRKFAAAFADSGVQAEQHLETFKKELDENELLRNDFPELCKPLTKSTEDLLSVDPAVTSKKSSDFTGLSVIAYSPSAKRAQVMFTVKVRLSSKKLRPLVLQICQAFPIKLILVESNQGGDLWEEAFEDIPGTKVTLIHQTDHKEVRAARFLAHCPGPLRTRPEGATQRLAGGGDVLPARPERRPC
jgi:hypothetical protein